MSTLLSDLKNIISNLKRTIETNYKVCPDHGEMFNFYDWQINKDPILILEKDIVM